ncbi:hypothetical protein ACFE04_000391 [Oxalis oulophora]
MDRISELPDDLIAIIISCLTRKEATTTSLISKRWRDLWKLYSGCFDFDGSHVPKPKLIFSKSLFIGQMTYAGTYVPHEETVKFANWVNRVLRSYKGAPMKRLRVFLKPNRVPGHYIDEWIQLATSKSVQCLELKYPWLESPGQPYIFPSISHFGFLSLKTLYLKRVLISVERLEYVITHSRNLEELNITKTSIMQSLKLYSLSLKHLTLYKWAESESESETNVHVFALNLLSFAFYPREYHRKNLFLMDSPKITCIKTMCPWCHFPNNLSQLHEFVFEMPSYFYSCDQSRSVTLPELPNLKKFTMKQCAIADYCFSRFVAFLKAAPLLENLTIEVSEDIELTEAKWNNVEYDHHRYNKLKTVTLIGHGATKDVEIIRYFLSCAPLLDKITIDPCHLFFLGSSEENSYRESSELYFADRKRIIGLTSGVFHNVTVV